MMDQKCHCGPDHPHSDPQQCADNRVATRIYMGAITKSGIDGWIARGNSLREQHDTHLTPVHGCPDCPLDSRFRRADAFSEWAI